jgi:hypothetical protein
MIQLPEKQIIDDEELRGFDLDAEFPERAQFASFDDILDQLACFIDRSR